MQAERIQPPHSLFLRKMALFFFTLDDWTKCQQRTTQSVCANGQPEKNSGVKTNSGYTSNINAHMGQLRYTSMATLTQSQCRDKTVLKKIIIKKQAKKAGILCTIKLITKDDKKRAITFSSMKNTTEQQNKTMCL